MGSGRFDPGDWDRYVRTRNLNDPGTTAQQIYTQSSMFPAFDPRGLKNGVREARDSADNPCSVPIIVGLDVTGSMERVLEAMAKRGLKTLFEQVYGRKPVPDPQVCCAAVGDVAAGDRAPLQVTQFEADIRIAEQLEKLYLEGGGGGNRSESYALVHYFAAAHTATDAWGKRRKKGYLFTVGDDGPTPSLSPDQLERVFGDEVGETLSAEELLTMASRQWEVFHLMVAEGGTYSAAMDRAWKRLLGERALLLRDHTKMAEVIVSTIQVLEGASAKAVADSWDGSTAIVVRHAIEGLTRGARSRGGIVTL
jgi:hypothetical protein